jgi:hypothetical protein
MLIQESIDGSLQLLNAAMTPRLICFSVIGAKKRSTCLSREADQGHELLVGVT